MKKRIWELDAFRGLCIIGVVFIHLVFDLVYLYEIVKIEAIPGWFQFLMAWGGVLFLVLSGICATLGSRSVRRGAIVFAGGMLCTAVTYGMYRMGFDASIIIYFGVLQCLGICMLVWPMYKDMSWWALLLHGIILAALGLYIDHLIAERALYTTSKWLMPLGIYWRGFSSSDYFPLLPHMGFFLIGAALGKTLYRKKQTLFPKVNDRNIILRALQFCGRQSLWIYLLHQPVLAGICYLITL